MALQIDRRLALWKEKPCVAEMDPDSARLRGGNPGREAARPGPEPPSAGSWGTESSKLKERASR